MNITIYHNPRCGKSRTACKLLDSKGKQATVVEYLKSPLSRVDLEALLKKMDKKPEEVIRKTERVFKENYKGKKCSDAEYLDALIAHPILLQRPIVVVDDEAWIVRDSNAVDDLLDALD